jgi:large subunit ribosomal protein L10
MNRDHKNQFVDEIRDRFNAAPMVILTDFKGSTVAQMNQLRRACEESDVYIRVVKNTLCRRAVAGTHLEPLSEHFRGNIAVLFAGEDPIGTAKLFKDQAKSNKNLVVRAGFFEGDVLDEKGVKLVAELPSKEELLSTLLATIEEGPRQVMRVIQGPPRDFLYILNNFAEKLEE